MRDNNHRCLDSISRVVGEQPVLGTQPPTQGLLMSIKRVRKIVGNKLIRKNTDDEMFAKGVVLFYLSEGPISYTTIHCSTTVNTLLTPNVASSLLALGHRGGG